MFDHWLGRSEDEEIDEYCLDSVFSSRIQGAMTKIMPSDNDEWSGQKLRII